MMFHRPTLLFFRCSPFNFVPSLFGEVDVVMDRRRHEAGNGVCVFMHVRSDTGSMHLLPAPPWSGGTPTIAEQTSCREERGLLQTSEDRRSWRQSDSGANFELAMAD